jgi:starch phosphorylase
LTHDNLDKLNESVAVQLNDTHPAIAVAELMRLLVDDHRLDWDRAWEITEKTLSYTNHTLLSEALEKWPVDLFQSLLPRHLEIINEINRRFLDEVQVKFPGDEERVQRMSVFEEGDGKFIRMGNLATIGSHAVNGVAALHSQLVKDSLLKDFYEMWPKKFSNKTNGVTPRRWIMLSNPRLSFLITEKIGKNWICDLEELRKLEGFEEDPGFRETWQIFKDESKRILAEFIALKQGLRVDPDSLFDVQVKRLHEYKRQLLMVLFIIHQYNLIKENPNHEVQPRTFIFGGKAAPGYTMAKLIIKLICSVADKVNSDPDVDGRLKVVFLENFSVSLGERVYPAADLSEQISMAGKEASGTGNMKFAMNGALTIGTYDGANIEIREAVGAENFFLFGSTVEGIRAVRERGYDPARHVEADQELAAVIHLLNSGHFAGGNRDLFRPIVDSLLYHDEYFLMADFRSYIDAQAQVSRTFQDQEKWTRMSILNVARMAYFSSDRTIREYASDIWNVKPVQVKPGEHC